MVQIFFRPFSLKGSDEDANVDSLLNPALYRFLDLIGLLFTHEWFPPFVIMPLMLIGAAVVRFIAVARTEPFIAAAKERMDYLVQVLGEEPNAEADRVGFRSKFIEISRTMSAAGPHIKELAEAWREFRETLIDETAPVIQNTSRPSSFFLRIIPKQTSLSFWSNIFVGLGLILTFLGLIVALNTAAQSMSGSALAAQEALKGLLAVAGAKFFSSIAGLVASIWLRWVEHHLTRKATAPTLQICSLLERGLQYVSPQTLAQYQLEVMREQRDQLLTFNTDFALQLSERIGGEFQRAMTPLAQSLDDLNQNMSSVTQGIGAGAAEAIQKVSGDQLRGLSETLARLNEKLDTIGTAVDKSGEAAADKIRQAGDRFAEAALGIQAAFDKLTTNVGTLGTRMTEQSDAAAKAQDEALARLMAGLQQAQEKSSEALAAAVQALSDASKAAAEDVQKGAVKGLTDAADKNRVLIEGAIAGATQGMSDALASFASSIQAAVRDVDSAGGKFAQSADGAGRSATAMGNVASQAERVAVALNSTSNVLAQASEPMVAAARDTASSVSKIAGSLDAYNAAQTQALGEMKELASGVRQTHSAAETAWRDYRARFEGVDQMLGKAVDTVTSCLNEFRKFAQDTDRELATAISKLGQIVEPIEEYAESLDEMVSEMRKRG